MPLSAQGQGPLGAGAQPMRAQHPSQYAILDSWSMFLHVYCVERCDHQPQFLCTYKETSDVNHQDSALHRLVAIVDQHRQLTDGFEMFW